MLYCGKKETQGHGSNSICGEIFYGTIWQCEACKIRSEPIDMVLHCPACHTQHVDAPNDLTQITHHQSGTCVDEIWTNPPHRSHLCHNCGHIWRPADVPTNGVKAVKTRGKVDKDIETVFTPIQERDNVLPRDGWQYPFESHENADVSRCYVDGDKAAGVVHIDGTLDAESLERLAAWLRSA